MSQEQQLDAKPTALLYMWPKPKEGIRLPFILNFVLEAWTEHHVC